MTDPPPQVTGGPDEAIDLTTSFAHVTRRPAGPITVGDRRSDRTVVKAIVVVLALVMAVLILNLWVGTRVLYQTNGGACNAAVSQHP